MGPCGPIAPAGPIAPVAPVGPAGPTAPVAPVFPTGPIGPAGPIGPVEPVAPVAPIGPAGPAAPVKPMGPCGPVAPIGPAGPIAPAAPVAPVSPFAPCGPAGPAGPTEPAGPIGPAGPAGPAGPWGPGGPWTPTPPPDPTAGSKVTLRSFLPCCKSTTRVSAIHPEFGTKTMTECLPVERDTLIGVFLRVSAPSTATFAPVGKEVTVNSALPFSLSVLSARSCARTFVLAAASTAKNKVKPHLETLVCIRIGLKFPPMHVSLSSSFGWCVRRMNRRRSSYPQESSQPDPSSTALSCD